MRSVKNPSKYRFIEIGKQLDIFDRFIVNEIVCYLESGYFDTTYLQQYFAAEDASLNSWDYLYDYWRLDNGNTRNTTGNGTILLCG